MLAKMLRRMVCVCGILAWLWPGWARAQPGAEEEEPSAGGFEISWFTIDGGGAASSGDRSEVAGTAGQPDAVASSAAGLEIRGGFWSVLLTGDIFSDGFESGDTSVWSQTIPAQGGF